MIIGVLKERRPGEQRVALTPDAVAALSRTARRVIIESGCGAGAGYSDQQYADAGARIEPDRSEVLQESNFICQVRSFPADPDHLADDLPHLGRGTVTIGLAEPLSDRAAIERYAETGVISFALELLPRITRAQAMDVLSSQANIAGYKAVLLAAAELPKIFPMMMTAAGTITPARVFVIGAGVAGLQAIATARRLGAVVQAYDVRPAVKEQVESVGGQFLQIELDAEQAEQGSGYASSLDEQTIAKQQELMATAVAEADVVITTAAVPGKPAPILITEKMARQMRPGSIIIDLAAERGGNCELTQPDTTVNIDNVRIFGPTNLPATVAVHTSQLFARNLVAFIKHLLAEDTGDTSATLTLRLNDGDEIIDQSLLTLDGLVINPRVREHFAMDQLPASRLQQAIEQYTATTTTEGTPTS